MILGLPVQLQVSLDIPLHLGTLVANGYKQDNTH
jgi:hypothetical protein